MINLSAATLRTPFAAGAMIVAICSAQATAQDATDSSGSASASVSEFEALKTCRTIAGDSERLACFDNAMGVVVAAQESGDLQVVDREAATQTRRKLFGFSIPDIGIFGSDDSDDDELFQTTITSARKSGRRQWTFTTAEGAVWQISNAPNRLRSIDEGQTVEFKPAAMGTYFIRIDGQMGIKGRRIR